MKPAPPSTLERRKERDRGDGQSRVGSSQPLARDPSADRRRRSVCRAARWLRASAGRGRGRRDRGGDQGRLFNPFFSGKPLGYGSGLGLFAVQGIAPRTGEVSTSPPYRAAECRSSSPCLFSTGRYSRPTRPPIRSSTTGPPPPKRARMLVVDDDPNVGKSLKLLLEGLGHDVVFERDPQAALERFRCRRAPSTSYSPT